VAQLVEAGEAVDAALAALLEAGENLHDVVDAIHTLGASHPSHDQVFSLGSRAVTAALNRSIWRRAFPVLAPSERYNFGVVTREWAARLEARCSRILGDEDQNEEAA
jgi:hypothetical protein